MLSNWPITHRQTLCMRLCAPDPRILRFKFLSVECILSFELQIYWYVEFNLCILSSSFATIQNFGDDFGLDLIRFVSFSILVTYTHTHTRARMQFEKTQTNNHEKCVRTALSVVHSICAHLLRQINYNNFAAMHSGASLETVLSNRCKTIGRERIVMQFLLLEFIACWYHWFYWADRVRCVCPYSFKETHWIDVNRLNLANLKMYTKGDISIHISHRIKKRFFWTSQLWISCIFNMLFVNTAVQWLMNRFNHQQLLFRLRKDLGACWKFGLVCTNFLCCWWQKDVLNQLNFECR